MINCYSILYNVHRFKVGVVFLLWLFEGVNYSQHYISMYRSHVLTLKCLLKLGGENLFTTVGLKLNARMYVWWLKKPSSYSNVDLELHRVISSHIHYFSFDAIDQYCNSWWTANPIIQPCHSRGIGVNFITKLSHFCSTYTRTAHLESVLAWTQFYNPTITFSILDLTPLTI